MCSSLYTASKGRSQQTKPLSASCKTCSLYDKIGKWWEIDIVTGYQQSINSKIEIEDIIIDAAGTVVWF